jgi:hypothetical protein
LSQQARGSRATLTEYTLFQKKVHIRQDEPKKDHFKVSLQKNPERICNNSTRPRKTRRLPKLNHEMLGGLLIRDLGGSPQGREKKI